MPRKERIGLVVETKPQKLESFSQTHEILSGLYDSPDLSKEIESPSPLWQATTQQPIDFNSYLIANTMALSWDVKTSQSSSPIQEIVESDPRRITLGKTREGDLTAP